MKLLYLWINKAHNDYIKEQGFNFSKEYDIEYIENTFKLTTKTFSFEYNEPIYNISAIVGKNGSGKSSVLRATRNRGTDCIYLFGDGDMFRIVKKFHPLDKPKIEIDLIALSDEYITYHIDTKNEPYSTTFFYYNSDIFDSDSTLRSDDGSIKIIEHSNRAIYTNLINDNTFGVQIIENRNIDYLQDLNNLVSTKYILNNKKFISDNLSSDKNDNNFDFTHIKIDLMSHYIFRYFSEANNAYSEAYGYWGLFNSSFLNEIHDYNYEMSKKTSLKERIYMNIFLCFLFNIIHTSLVLVSPTNEEYEEKIKGFSLENYYIINKDNFITKLKDIYIFFADKNLLPINEIEALSPVKNINKLFAPISEYIENIDTENLKTANNNSILIKLDADTQDDFVDFYTDIFNARVSNGFNFEYSNSVGTPIKFSSGELQITSLLSRIDIMFNPLNKSNSFRKLETDSLIIFLDEPETHLHPEWSRRLINALINYFNELHKENSKLNVQIILTTNSPFTLSDMPKDNVICLDNGKVIHPDIDTFGQNIYTLMQSNFFMNDAMGEFALSTIKKLNEEIDEIISKSEKNGKDANGNLKLDKDIYDTLMFKINCIGEPTIKTALNYKMEVFAPTYPDKKIDDIMTKYRELETLEKEQLIKQIIMEAEAND